jgi:virginiamycin A acetyltransferase
MTTDAPAKRSWRLELGKWVLGACARVAATGLYLSYCVRVRLLGDRAFRGSAQLLSLVPGLAGDYLRREFYRLTLVGCGRSSQIAFGTLLSTARARIGEHVYIGAFCNVGWADIGDNVLLGSNVHVLSGRMQHGIADVSVPIRLQERGDHKVTIGADTWIGNGAIVMANVGRKCVVGAGSVVVNDIEDYTVVGGHPARALKRRA